MKQALVDFDGTIINFVELFYNKINEKFGYNLKATDCLDYDFTKHFKKEEIPQKRWDVLFQIWEEDDFYAEAQFLPQWLKIKDFINENKDRYMFSLVSLSKGIGQQMSKWKFIDRNHFGEIFNQIDISLSTKKSLNWDLIIEDSPVTITKYIKDRLKKYEQNWGVEKPQVLMVKHPYNQSLLTNKKYSPYIKEI